MRFERAYALTRPIALPDGELNFLRVLNDYRLTIATDVQSVPPTAARALGGNLSRGTGVIAITA